MNVNAILLKPLDGQAPGSPRSFDKADFERLRGMGAVREADDDDAIEPPRDEDVLLLERLRHPIDGPELLREMKARFEAMTGQIDELRGKVAATAIQAGVDASAANAQIADLTRERDELIGARDQATEQLDAANKRIAELEEKATDPSPPPAEKPAKQKAAS